jgi:hypothetical protein
MQEHFHFTTDRASSRFLDARSKKSANSPIRRMETVDETKTQSD